MIYQILNKLHITAWLKRFLKVFHIYVSASPVHHPEYFGLKVQETFIRRAKFVLHLGGHEGQEAQKYSDLGASVIWIEAIPSVHEILERNASKFSNQKTVCALLGDENNTVHKFNVASNGSASSSLYKFGRDAGVKDLKMLSQIELEMHRLDSLFSQDELAPYIHWVIDVQGAELKVLRGAGNLLQICKSLTVEVSTREVYESGTTWSELEDFLNRNGFFALWKPEPYSHENIVFIRF